MKSIRITLTNRFAYITSKYSYKRLSKVFSFYPSGYRFSPQFRSGAWNGRICLINRRGNGYHRIPAGLFRAFRFEAEQEAQRKFKVTYEREDIVWRDKEEWLLSEGKYVFQNKCTDKMMLATPKGGGLIINATGSGKTRIAAMYASRIKGRLLFVVDQVQLMYQAQKDIEKHLGEKVGVVGNSEFEPRRVTVATVQTLHKHCKDKKFRKWTKKIRVIIIDEIHQAMNRQNFKVVTDIKPKAVFGLTATLQMKRKDIRMRAWSLAGPVLFEYPVTKGMEAGVLAKGIVVDVYFENWIDEDDQLSYIKDYEEEIVKNESRNKLIRKLVEECDRRGKYIIVLMHRIIHIRLIDSILGRVKHKLAYGEVDVRDRLRLSKQFERGDFRCILANQVFKKGIDIKRVDVTIDAAGLRSKDDAIQKFGRALRTHAAKEGAIHFNIRDVGNRFEPAARSRSNAFKKAGLTVVKWEWERKPDIKALVDFAEAELRKEIAK